MDRLAALSKPRAIEPAEEETQIVVKKKSVKPPMPPSSTQSQSQPQRKRAKSKRDSSTDGAGGGNALKKLKRKRSSSNQGSQSRGVVAAQINYENLLEHREKRTAAKENKQAKGAPLAIEYKVPAKDKT
jgi:hypothetical protein